MSNANNIKITTSTIYRSAVKTMPDGQIVKKRFSIMDSDETIIKAMENVIPEATKSTKENVIPEATKSTAKSTKKDA
ncbi:MAG: hypothetical protein L3J71_03535 [Victivallaceae bacterium]|nr:hypothetical protein [Victivallaceae bacterium]